MFLYSGLPPGNSPTAKSLMVRWATARAYKLKPLKDTIIAQNKVDGKLEIKYLYWKL